MPTRRKPPAPASTRNIAGISPAAVRDFLLQSAEVPNWPVAEIEKILGVDPQAAKGVLAALTAAGYVEPGPDAPGRWRNTAEGNAMAGVPRARPFKRKTAEKALAEFLVINRVRQVNLEPAYLYSIERVVVFGPYLAGGDSVKNVDVAIELKPKIADEPKLEERVEADAQRAESEGKRFKSFADRRAWGVNKVKARINLGAFAKRAHLEGEYFSSEGRDPDHRHHER